MLNFLITHYSGIYFLAFIGVILVMSLAECWIPRKVASNTLKLRWSGNASLQLIGTAANNLVFPVVGIGFAALCTQRGWGLFNHVAIPSWLAALITFVVLDLMIYVRHRLGHTVFVLWLLHRLHHTDDDVDFTTTLRFHPLDVLYMKATDLGMIALLGAPVSAVLIFQLVSTFFNFLAHSNIRMPESLDRYCRKFIVTPCMHRIHHSREFKESNSNYGDILPFWDRWFGTYTEHPKAGYMQMTTGLPEFSERKHQSLHMMLVHPFLRARPAATAQKTSEEQIQI